MRAHSRAGGRNRAFYVRGARGAAVGFVGAHHGDLFGGAAVVQQQAPLPLHVLAVLPPEDDEKDVDDVPDDQANRLTQ